MPIYTVYVRLLCTPWCSSAQYSIEYSLKMVWNICGFSRHIGTIMDARNFFFRITFVTVSYLASSIRIPTFLSFIVPFFLIKKKVKFNLLPDSRRALVALSNLSTLVSMANGHCSHSNLSPDTKYTEKNWKESTINEMIVIRWYLLKTRLNLDVS